jgi:23S rRNA pseudouridine2605 synthase
MHRVQKLLSNYGYCSRRKAEELIKEGRVRVNSKVITIGDKADLKDKIYVDDKLVGKDKFVYLMFNKPVGCVTALNDKHYKTVMEYIKIQERVFPVGRLDYNTSGLLFLTNDGDFSNKVIHPRYEVEKTYLVTLDEEITLDDIESIRKGVSLDDGKTAPAKVSKKGLIVEIIIHEGKNRIVRRIIAKLGYRIKSLKRIKIGKVNLGSLEEGKFRKLNSKEIELFR